MRRLIVCSDCGARFVQELPDVTEAEASALRAANDNSGVMFKCPTCQKEIWVPRSALPGLLEPP
jgi:hypothetical protein